MKKIAVVLVVLMVTGLMSGCSTIVKRGTPLCREDFNFYTEGSSPEISKDPDSDDKGYIVMGFDEVTARGIKYRSTLNDLKKAYAGTNLTDISFTDSFLKYMCSIDGYELHFSLDSEKEKVFDVSVKTDEYVKKFNEEVDAEVETTMREIMGDELYDEVFIEDPMEGMNDEEKAGTTAAVAHKAITEGEYTLLFSMFNEEQLPEDIEGFKSLMNEILDMLGTFTNYGSYSVSTGTEEKYGDIMVVELECIYSDKTIMWEVYLDSDFKILRISPVV